MRMAYDRKAGNKKREGKLRNTKFFHYCIQWLTSIFLIDVSVTVNDFDLFMIHKYLYKFLYNKIKDMELKFIVYNMSV